MELETVAQLLVYVVVALLGTERIWQLLGRGSNSNGKNGKLDHLKQQVQNLRDKRMEEKLNEILAWVKDNHEDIESMRQENTRLHSGLIKRYEEDR